MINKLTRDRFIEEKMDECRADPDGRVLLCENPLIYLELTGNYTRWGTLLPFEYNFCLTTKCQNPPNMIFYRDESWKIKPWWVTIPVATSEDIGLYVEKLESGSLEISYKEPKITSPCLKKYGELVLWGVGIYSIICVGLGVLIFPSLICLLSSS